MGSDEEREQREQQGVDALRADPEERARRSDAPEPDEQHGRIPRSRIGRSARLGTAMGGQATRYAGTAAANVVRSEEKAQERLETRHLETALKMASVLGEMKGAAMKIGQMASFIDADFLPPEYREIYQEQLSKLRTHAPAMP
jgi:predicted unusual protein kinase regulating ubiquinone biosynthesis (AarF/ABC1/UbiB family)